MRTWLLAGVPRSGTSLCCRLAGRLPGTVALADAAPRVRRRAHPWGGLPLIGSPESPGMSPEPLHEGIRSGGGSMRQMADPRGMVARFACCAWWRTGQR